jgi:hypothetical protein
MLERLAEMANQQEQAVEELIGNSEPESNRTTELTERLERIKTIRQKAEEQLRVKGIKFESKNPVK